MLQRSQSNTQTYKIRPDVKVTVRNTEAADDEGNTFFKTTVTLNHKLEGDKPLVFADSDEISDFIHNIDLLDDQTSMELSQGE